MNIREKIEELKGKIEKSIAVIEEMYKDGYIDADDVEFMNFRRVYKLVKVMWEWENWEKVDGEVATRIIIDVLNYIFSLARKGKITYLDAVSMQNDILPRFAYEEEEEDDEGNIRVEVDGNMIRKEEFDKIINALDSDGVVEIKGEIPLATGHNIEYEFSKKNGEIELVWNKGGEIKW